MAQAANDNTVAATAGSLFYPEMGERHDGNALFVVQVGYGGYYYYVSWSPDRHAEALAVFKSLRIRPRHMECADKISGGKKWSCGVTWDAGRKLVGTKYAVIEALLD